MLVGTPPETYSKFFSNLIHITLCIHRAHPVPELVMGHPSQHQPCPPLHGWVLLRVFKSLSGCTTCGGFKSKAYQDGILLRANTLMTAKKS